VGISKWKMFGQFYRVHNSETYKDTMRSVDKLASTSLMLLNRKSAEEQREILARAESLTEKINDAVAEEIPLVIVLSLLTALRVHEHNVQQHVEGLGTAQG